MGGASDDHVAVGHVAVFSDQVGPTDKTSTSNSAMWEARAHKSPYENSHNTRTT